VIAADDEFSTTAKVLLVLVALAPLNIGFMWFTIARKVPQRSRYALARGALWTLFAMGLTAFVVGVSGARWVPLVATVMLIALPIGFRRR